MTILTVAQLREHVNSALADAAIQRLLDDAEAAIVAVTGASGSVTELLGGGYPTLVPTRPVSAVTTVREIAGDVTTTLAADDWRFRSGGYVIERLADGTTPRATWNTLVELVYTPIVDDPQRKRVQVDLVKLELAYSGHDSQSAGDYSEGHATSNYGVARDALLGTLVEPRMVVVGG